MHTPAPTPAHAPLAAANPGAAHDDPRPLVERQLWLLERLAEAGLNIVLAVERQVVDAAAATAPSATPALPAPFRGQDPEAAPDERADAANAERTPAAPPATLGDLALAYSRAARGVRLCIALQTKLVTDAEAALRAAQLKATTTAILDGPGRSQRLPRIVRRVARAEHDDDATVDWLVGEAVERMSDSDRFGNIMSRPISEIIDVICRDLGLNPDWAVLAQEGWAQEELRTPAPGPRLAPFAALRPGDLSLRPPRPPPGFPPPGFPPPNLAARPPWAPPFAAASP